MVRSSAGVADGSLRHGPRERLPGGASCGGDGAGQQPALSSIVHYRRNWYAYSHRRAPSGCATVVRRTCPGVFIDSSCVAEPWYTGGELGLRTPDSHETGAPHPEYLPDVPTAAESGRDVQEDALPPGPLPRGTADAVRQECCR